MDNLVKRLERNSGWRNERWQCVTDPALLTEAAARITELETALAEAGKQLRENAETLAQVPAAIAEARRQSLEEAAKVAEDLGGNRIERNPDGSLQTYDMNCKHGRGDAVLNAMRVRAQTIAQAIRDMKDRT